MASVKKIATELNWELDKNKAYGSYKEFTISLVQNVSYSNSQNNFKLLSIPVSGIREGNIQQFEAFIKANKKEMKIVDYQISNNVIMFRLTELFKGFDGEKLLNLLDRLIQEFTVLDIQPRTTCVYCEEENTETFSYINDIKYPAHETCKQKAIEEVQALKEQHNNQTSSLMSYVGAVLGAIIGVIPYVIAVWFGWYVGLLTFVTGFSSYFFFQKFEGKTLKSTKIIISLITIVVVVLSNFAIIEFVAIQNSVRFSDVLAIPELFDIFLEMLGMSLLFGFLGATGVYARIKRDEFDTEIK